jgi:hypothetical protein
VNSRLICLLVVAGAVTQILGHYASAHLFLLYNVYTPIEYSIVFFFFKTNYSSKRGKKIFYFLAIAGFAMALYFLIFVGVKGRFISEWVCFNNIIYTAWILSMLLEIYEDDAIYLNQKMPLFWYLLGMFFFTSCTILIFCFWDDIMTTKNLYVPILFSVYSLFNIFMYIAFAIGLLLDASDNLKMNKKN